MADPSTEERLTELELQVDERLVKLENFQAEGEAALKTIGESLQTLNKGIIALERAVHAIEKWRKS